MLADIEAGKVGTVIVKDMSRLGRNYLQVGFYTEMLFPQKGVRFIAVNDNVDSANGGMDNDFTPLRNLFNEWLVRDTSKKIKAVKRAKGMSGKPVTSKPVYGYLMDEDENYIVDEETAPVVKQIYQLCLAGTARPRLPVCLRSSKSPRRGRWNTAGRAAPAATTPATSASGRQIPLSTCWKTGVPRLSGKLQDGEALLQDQAQRREPHREAGHFPEPP